MKDQYESPLSSRYASRFMLELFSPDTRYRTWRRLWTALARAEMELGLPVARREKETRHDVMAHVWAYGQAAPSAAGIIHLGATSCYVTDNADLIIYRDGLRYLSAELKGVLKQLCGLADQGDESISRRSR